MVVHFIGAGPGSADLITLRGLNYIKQSQVCLYAGSLVPEDLLAYVPAGAKVINTATLTLAQIIGHMKWAHARNFDVARLHSGDLSLYSAVQEQISHLKALAIAYDLTPGVPAYAAAAAELGQELTIPCLNQSVILSRVSVNSSPMPPQETLENLAASQATLVLHLAIGHFEKIKPSLMKLYGHDCPVIIGARISWPDQIILKGRLDTIADDIAKAGITKSALIFIGQALNQESATRSALYQEHQVPS